MGKVHEHDKLYRSTYVPRRIKRHDTLVMEKMVDPHPVGFRFHPTDEEIIGYYLREKNMDSFDPWELPCKSYRLLHCCIETSATHSSSIRKDDVWYFFARKDNKYVHTKKKVKTTNITEEPLFSKKEDKYNRGGRQSRKKSSGFWKKTGVTVNMINPTVQQPMTRKKKN
ncbi:hypothetical protein HID58_030430 [Brassica napus]|uniref:NAC domain-containing protein n=1 Tax=Brassica napus TaxID=3708 RepID=A0ABQ8CFX0_BRANA|nr:hypothetical protein HID58_030430 [Brassica napus]